MTSLATRSVLMDSPRFGLPCSVEWDYEPADPNYTLGGAYVVSFRAEPIEDIDFARDVIADLNVAAGADPDEVYIDDVEAAYPTVEFANAYIDAITQVDAKLQAEIVEDLQAAGYPVEDWS